MKKNSDVPKNKGGKPKKFATKEEFTDVYFEFIQDVVDSGFDLFPSQLRFCMWYAGKYGNLDPKTVYNTTSKYFPTLKKDMQNMLSDMLTEAVSKGIYQPTMIIFALKNWCGWADRPEHDTNEEVLAKLDTVLDKIQ